MKRYDAEVSIDAPPEHVWTVLVDTARWPEWDPFCERIEGDLSLGAKVKAFSKLSPGRGFAVRVTTLDEPRRMVWTGGMPLGLFKGERTFVLTPRDDGGTDFAMTETFSGPMLALIGGSIPDMSDAFEAFVKGLRGRAETGAD